MTVRGHGEYVAVYITNFEVYNHPDNYVYYYDNEAKVMVHINQMREIKAEANNAFTHSNSQMRSPPRHHWKKFLDMFKTFRNQ